MNLHLESQLAQLRREHLRREAEESRRAKNLQEEAKKSFNRENV